MEEQKKPRLHYTFDNDDSNISDLNFKSNTKIEDNINLFFDPSDEHITYIEEESADDMFPGMKPDQGSLYSNGTRIPDSVYGRNRVEVEEPEDEEQVAYRQKRTLQKARVFWFAVFMFSFFTTVALESIGFLGGAGAKSYPLEGAMLALERLTNVPAALWKSLLVAALFGGAMMIGCGTPLPYFMRPDGRKNEVEDKGMTYMAHTLVGICSAVYSILYYEIWGGADVLLLLPRIFFAFAIITLFTGELRLHTLAENQKKGIGLLILSSVLFCIVFTFVLYQVIVPLALIYAYAKLCKFTDTGNHNYDNYYI